EVPEADRLIAGKGHQLEPPWQKYQPGDGSLMGVQDSRLVTVVQLPVVHVPINGGREQCRIAAEGQSAHPRRQIRPDCSFGAVRRIPEADRLTVAAGRYRLAIRRNRQPLDSPLMALQHALHALFWQVPETNRPVAAAAGGNSA